MDSGSFASKTSTAFTRPLSCMSYVSSTTAGTSLTQKMERMNRATLKLLAKQVLSCRAQLEQSLACKKLLLKSKLTIPEMQMCLQGTDLATLGLSAVQNLLVGVMLIQ